MLGYIFETENTVTGKKYIGQIMSVSFIRKHFGNHPALISDLKKYGLDKFTVKMLRACETKQDYDMAYSAFLEEARQSGKDYYNFVTEAKTEDDGEEVKPVKKSRKKKVVEK